MNIRIIVNDCIILIDNNFSYTSLRRFCARTRSYITVAKDKINRAKIELKEEEMQGKCKERQILHSSSQISSNEQP